MSLPTVTASMINVPDVERTIAWYTALGFDVVADHTPEPEPGAERARNWALLRLGGAELMVNAGGRPGVPGQRRDVAFFLYTEDVDALYAQLAPALPEGSAPPEDHWTGLRQFIICDPDGFELCFAKRL